ARFADGMFYFNRGARGVLPAPYEAAADEVELNFALGSVLDDTLRWLEGRETLRQSVSLEDIKNKAIEIATARMLYTEIGGVLRGGVFGGGRGGVGGGGGSTERAPKLLPQFTATTVDEVVASSARLSPGGQISEGARAIAKKLGHAIS